MRNYDIPELRAEKCYEFWNSDYFGELGHVDWSYLLKPISRPIYAIHMVRSTYNTNHALSYGRKLLEEKRKMSTWTSFDCVFPFKLEEKVHINSIVFAFTKKEDLILFQLFSEFKNFEIISI